MGNSHLAKTAGAVGHDGGPPGGLFDPSPAAGGIAFASRRAMPAAIVFDALSLPAPAFGCSSPRLCTCRCGRLAKCVPHYAWCARGLATAVARPEHVMHECFVHACAWMRLVPSAGLACSLCLRRLRCSRVLDHDATDLRARGASERLSHIAVLRIARSVDYECSLPPSHES